MNINWHTALSRNHYKVCTHKHTLTHRQSCTHSDFVHSTFKHTIIMKTEAREHHTLTTNMYMLEGNGHRILRLAMSMSQFLVFENQKMYLWNINNVASQTNNWPKYIRKTNATNCHKQTTNPCTCFLKVYFSYYTECTASQQ